METPSRGPYATTQWSTQTREAIALLALYATREGAGVDDFYSLVEQSPLGIPKRTLYRDRKSTRLNSSHG